MKLRKRKKGFDNATRFDLESQGQFHLFNLIFKLHSIETIRNIRNIKKIYISYT